MILVSAKPMLLFPVIFRFSSLQMQPFKNLFQPDNPRITQLLPTPHGCSKQKKSETF